MSILQWNRILNFQACVVHAVYFKDREQKLQQQQQQATISLSGSCINIPASNQLQFSFVWIPFLVCWNKMKRKNSIRSVLLRMCVCIIWSWVFVFRVFNFLLFFALVCLTLAITEIAWILHSSSQSSPVRARYVCVFYQSSFFSFFPKWFNIFDEIHLSHNKLDSVQILLENQVLHLFSFFRSILLLY